MSIRSGKETYMRRPKITRSLPLEAVINCADNTGAKKLKVVQVLGYKGRLRRIPAACVGDHIKVTVTSGPFKLRKQVLDAILVRQKASIRRVSGIRVMFEDNAAVLITPDGQPMGTEIKGPVAVEAADIWPRLANMASIIH
ncbi:MAG: 50S ribosomal protein L14 [Nitrososphaeria archaeon]|nr:50S ribosomal protein L14 [Nitrososphaeria archaeon]